MIAAVCVAVAATAIAARADEFDKPPINYTTASPGNRVATLEQRIAAGETTLGFEPHFGYLRSVLRELGVPQSSQTLVFSKTSLQRHRIAPETPRALYFSDDVYMGFCQNGDVMEVSAVDPQLGAVFYTVDQREQERPKLVRQGDSCLICHASSQTQGVPGHVVRSVYSDEGGLPILASGTYRIDHTSPLKHRWGGWYVTGTHGQQTHLGNLIIRDKRDPERVDNSAGMNVTDLHARIDTHAYLTPHSDIVALLVLEHQTEAHNRITRANFVTRQALFLQASLNRELGKPADYQWESTASRIKSAAEPLVEYLLFSEEAGLTAPVQGTSGFAEQFSRQGPFDRQGRSLREFDLQRRIFKYPCSYLIYSPSFDALPDEAKSYVYRRLWDVLSGRDTSRAFANLSTADRAAILEILLETKADFSHSEARK